MFYYNWQVRDEWFRILESIPMEELLRKRIGGVGTILQTIFHIIDAEYSWIRALKNESDIAYQSDDYKDVQSLRKLSKQLRSEVTRFVDNWSDDMESETVTPSWMNTTFLKGEVLRHIIVHEVHHIGQLSVWSRELGIAPASASFIGRQLMKSNSDFEGNGYGSRVIDC